MSPTSPSRPFPAAGRGAPVPARERLLAALVAGHLVFLAWAFGGVHPWSQLVGLGLSGLELAVVLWPRPSTGAGSRLLRLPFFWLGLAVLAYQAVQGLNPAWRYAANADYWWLEARPHVGWLPSGVDAPFARANAWRAMTVWGSLWLTACAVWVGFTRARPLRWCAAALVGSGFALVLVGLLQRTTAARGIFWTVDAGDADFFGSFFYRNHAGAYLNLLTATALGLAGWWAEAGRGGGRRSDLVALFGAVAFLLGLGVVFCGSRGALALLALPLAVAGLLALRRTAVVNEAWRRAMQAGFLLLFAAMVAVAAQTLHPERIWARTAAAAADPAREMRPRLLAWRATAAMAAERWGFGWGAGAFRHAFPLHAREYPEIYFSRKGGRLYWENAHCDWLEFPSEYGLAGSLLGLAAAATGAVAVVRRANGPSPLPVLTLAGVAAVLVHAGGDFILQCPAVAQTSAVLVAASARWWEWRRRAETGERK